MRIRRVMVTGHFDGLHSGHLDYIEQAVKYGDSILCVVSSDKQLLMKKGKVNIPEKERFKLVDTLIRGLGYDHMTIINVWDKDTKLIAEALRTWQPEVLFRGYDKTLETMPVEERKVCEELHIEIVHAKNRIGERHSSEVFG